MGLLHLVRRGGGSNRRVLMVNSVGDLVAGETYDIPAELADRFIARGYAKGEYSQAYTPNDLAALRGNNHQTVTL